MKQLLLATNNPGKLSEMRLGLGSLAETGWRLFSLDELGINNDPEETGATFRDNALLKARYYSELAKMPALADDGGFVIPALNNEPGVRSRRWLGREADDEELIDHTLKKMAPFAQENRRAYLELVICFFDPRTQIELYENERIRGYIASKPADKRVKGFPYRALLKVEPYDKYYDELTPEEHEKVNHRLKALRQLSVKLKEHYA